MVEGTPYMPTMASTQNHDQSRQHCFFQQWINLQKQDLSELLQTLDGLNPDDPDKDSSLTQLALKNTQHFQDYIDQRIHLARDDVSAFFAPTWCTSLENSLLWIAGCRPSIFIRLIYALCGLEVESRLTEFLMGERTGNLGELSARQLGQVNDLQCKTIREEEKISSRFASLQEEVADQPLAVIAKQASQIGELNGDTDRALDEHARSMASVLEEADQLRLSTIKELIEMLTPMQAVEFLAASKKLHLCMHEWGRKRDHVHGRD